jgi:hypothetical protein
MPKGHQFYKLSKISHCSRHEMESPGYEKLFRKMRFASSELFLLGKKGFADKRKSPLKAFIT